MEKRKIGVIFGGRSGEHNVSFMSAKTIISGIDENKFKIVPIGITKEGQWRLFTGERKELEPNLWLEKSSPLNIQDLEKIIDFAFPALHGTFCEDGTLQGFFETMKIPYAGCGVLSSAISMDKAIAKDIFIRNGIPTCNYELVFKEDLEQEEENILIDLEDKFTYPMYVKPANSGSSVGISRAENKEELKKALKLAGDFDRRILVEESIDGREVETGVIGNEVIKVASVGEIKISGKFYDYNSKYDENTAVNLVIPAQLPLEISERVRFIAAKVYRAMDCSGFARVDFFIEKKTGRVLVNEINTIPGFTKNSMFPLLWKDCGVDLKTLVERIIEFGYERYNLKNNFKTNC